MKNARVQKRGEIVIRKPRLDTAKGKSRLSAEIRFWEETREVWFEVDEKYGQYLCWERSDAFLIGLLNFAMREGCDIVCEAPVTAQLLYQIRTYLLPSLVRNSKVLYETQITAPMAEKPVSNAGGVGTGISCGVDSLHAVRKYMSSPYPGLKLTHLVLNNVGAFRPESNQYDWQANHAIEFCREYGFELIVSNSNFAEAFPQNHLLTHTYSSVFAVYMLQKLWGVYFYASAGYDLQEAFTLVDNELKSSDHYELLSLDVFSTRALKIYSEGSEIARFEKIKDLSTWTPAQKHLHVCTSDEGPNCNTCGKCLRTLVTLDALGCLDSFKDVFDIAAYRASRKNRLRWLYLQQHTKNGDKMTAPAYAILKSEITAWDRLCACVSFLYFRLRSRLSRVKFLYNLVHPLLEWKRKNFKK